MRVASFTLKVDDTTVSVMSPLCDISILRSESSRTSVPPYTFEPLISSITMTLYFIPFFFFAPTVCLFHKPIWLKLYEHPRHSRFVGLSSTFIPKNSKKGNSFVRFGFSFLSLVVCLPIVQFLHLLYQVRLAHFIPLSFGHWFRHWDFCMVIKGQGPYRGKELMKDLL